jgi:SNF2 family DNA or RNA helicase
MYRLTINGIGEAYLRKTIRDTKNDVYVYVEFVNTISMAQAMAIGTKERQFGYIYDEENYMSSFVFSNKRKYITKTQKVIFKDIVNKQFLQVAIYPANNEIYYVNKDYWKRNREVYEILASKSAIPFPKLDDKSLEDFIFHFIDHIHTVEVAEYNENGKNVIEDPNGMYVIINPISKESLLNYFNFTIGEPIAIKDFITQHSNILKKKVLSQLKPLFVKSRDFKQNQFEGLLRKPLPAQEAPILSLVKGLQSKKGLFVVGEMGVGKTFISIATVSLMKSKRTIILCPTHLVEKWKREIETTIKGAKVLNLNSMSISEILALRGTKPSLDEPEFWIIGKEQAKLHYALKDLPVKEKRNTEAKTVNENGEVVYDYIPYHYILCPDCGNKIDISKKSMPYKCPKCNSVLQSADNTGVRRYAKSLLLKKYFKFDLCIADEVHELKGGETAQGQALANLTSASKKVLALTGTLMGGYAKNLFYLMWRVAPQIMVKLGLNYDKPQEFIERFGVYENITVDYKRNKESIGNKRGVRKVFKEKAGISPLLISYLLENSVYIKLADISSSLPSYEEEIISVEMSEEQAKVYKNFEAKITDKVRKMLVMGSKAGLGKMVQSLYALPDGIRRGESVELGREFVIAPPVDEPITTKEQQLIDIVKAEKEAGRKVLVFLEHTGTRDLMPELKERLEDAIDGIKIDLLYSSSTKKVEQREAWITKHNDNDVLIVNPRLVQTGLDLYDYPSIVFFQTGYSIFTLRQASRRSWRIGQTKPVKVYYLTYANTLQERAIKLIASKMEASLATEGDLSDKGLVALSEADTSMIAALARSIAEKDEVNIDVKSAWTKAVQADLFSDAIMSETHDITTTETTEEKTVVETKVDDRVVKTKFKVVSQVKVENNLAIFKIENKVYQLKDGKVISENKVVGKYVWKTSAKTGKKFAVCKLPNKIVYVGKHRQTGRFVALEIA